MTTTTPTALTTVRTPTGLLTLTPTALASGRYDVSEIVELIPARSERQERRWDV